MSNPGPDAVDDELAGALARMATDEPAQDDLDNSKLAGALTRMLTATDSNGNALTPLRQLAGNQIKILRIAAVMSQKSDATLPELNTAHQAIRELHERQKALMRQLGFNVPDSQ